VGMGKKEDESSIECVWDAGFHHFTARSRLALVFKLMNGKYVSSFLQATKALRESRGIALVCF
jgi:hypothetical protein